MKNQSVRVALRQANETIQRDPGCPYHLVKRSVAILLQAEDAALSIEDAEADLLQAYRRDPKHLEALEELAHYYDAVSPDREKAKEYARQCRDMAARLVSDMDEILEGNPE